MHLKNPTQYQHTIERDKGKRTHDALQGIVSGLEVTESLFLFLLKLVVKGLFGVSAVYKYGSR